MGFYTYGANSTSGIYVNASPASHALQHWGTPVVLPLQAQHSIGASVAITTNQAFVMSPFPYMYIWDIVYSVSGSGAATNTVAIYDSFSAGSIINSLSGATTITPSISATPTQFSARFATAPKLKVNSDPELATTYWANTPAASNSYIYSRGQIFSLRCTTPGGGSLTDLEAQIIAFVSDRPFDGS